MSLLSSSSWGKGLYMEESLATQYPWFLATTCWYGSRNVSGWICLGIVDSTTNEWNVNLIEPLFDSELAVAICFLPKFDSLRDN